MLLSKEENNLINQISSKLGCVICSTICSSCSALSCGHYVCLKCTQQPGLKCPKCISFNIKSSFDTTSNPLVRNITEAFVKFRHYMDDNLSNAENEDHASIHSQSQLEQRSSIEISCSYPHSVADSQESGDTEESVVLTDLPAINAEAPKDLLVDVVDGASVITAFSEPQQHPIYPHEGSSSLHTFSNTCGDWLNDIQNTKAAIEQLIANNYDNHEIAVVDNNQIAMTVVEHEYEHEKMEEEESDECTLAESVVVNTTAIPIIAEYRNHHDAALLLDQCVVKGWISIGDGHRISVCDDRKVCVVESVYQQNVGYCAIRSLLYMKALLLGFHIVDIDWLRDSIAQNVLLDPLLYQVNGTTFDHLNNNTMNDNENDSIESQQTQTPPEPYSRLFQYYAFHILDSTDHQWNTQVKQEVMWMIDVAGGKVINSANNNDIADPNNNSSNNSSNIQHILTIKLQLKSKYPTVYLDTSFDNDNELMAEATTGTTATKTTTAYHPQILCHRIISVSWIFDAICAGQIPRSLDAYYI